MAHEVSRSTLEIPRMRADCRIRSGKPFCKRSSGSLVMLGRCRHKNVNTSTCNRIAAADFRGIDVREEGYRRSWARAYRSFNDGCVCSGETKQCRHKPRRLDICPRRLNDGIGMSCDQASGRGQIFCVKQTSKQGRKEGSHYRFRGR